jgi:competence protein ComEC
MEGVVVDEPDKREGSLRLVLQSSALIFPKEVDISSKILLTTDLYPEYSYGDKIQMSGLLQEPQNFTNDLGREFNYKVYLAKDGIFYQMFRPQIELVEKNQGNFFKEKILSFKYAFISHIEQTIPEPASSLAGGLLLGVKQSLGAKILDDFRKVGLIHIVVLSGYNITIVAESLMRFFGFFLRRRIASLLGLLSIVLFAVMVGAGATVVRASIMASLVIVARLTGRDFNALRALCIAGFVMLMHNPKILLFDPSFQLSFMATLGLIYLSPLVLKYIQFLPERFGFRELTASTISTQIFVLPLLLYMMGELSLVALPANLLVLVLVPYAMLLSFITGSVGFISGIFAVPFGFLSYLVLAYMFKMVELFAALPFASVKISYFPLWLMVIVYVVYGYVLYKQAQKSETSAPILDSQI